jgi:type IV pilus assembly protein PilA
MKICPACTKPNDDAAAFCSNCGAQFSAAGSVPPQAPPPQPSWQPQTAPQYGPQETSGLAIASLICGFLFFIFPAAVLAIVFGHISSSQIRKSAGRLKGAGMSLAGMILGYVGIAFIPIILIIAAIAIPNLLRAKMAANEASAISSLRDISRAAIQYQDTYHEYPSGLSALGPPLQGHGPDADGADLIDGLLMNGSKEGYMFEYHPVSSRGDSVFDGFDINADPITPGATGTRHFHTDESDVIRFERSTQAGRESPPLE